MSSRFTNPHRAEEARGKVSADWRQRIDDVLACPDNALIPRVSNAGELRDGWITMHNGTQVSALGYCGAGMMNLLIENRGVHEPQQELAFAEVLKYQVSGSSMLEVGCNWSFYSLWFATSVQQPRCYLIEPSLEALSSGKINFQKASHQAVFHQAYVGAEGGRAKDQLPIATVDSFSSKQGIDHWAILHADIDGAEVELLRGAHSLLEQQKIDYVFLSTHGNIFHCACSDLLQARGYKIVISIESAASYSVDGLIVAHSRTVDAPALPAISKKAESAFLDGI